MREIRTIVALNRRAGGSWYAAPRSLYCVARAFPRFLPGSTLTATSSRSSPSWTRTSSRSSSRTNSLPSMYVLVGLLMCRLRLSESWSARSSASWDECTSPASSTQISSPVCSPLSSSFLENIMFLPKPSDRVYGPNDIPVCSEPPR